MNHAARAVPPFVPPLLALLPLPSPYPTPSAITLLSHPSPHRLRWNLDGDRALEFGDLVSSSNEIVGERVTVRTTAPLLWTTGLR